MGRKNALLIYLSGTLGQMLIVCILVFIFRSINIKVDYSTIPGLLFIGVGGLSSALWGIIVSIKYKNISLKQILLDFVNIKNSSRYYILVIFFLFLDFCYVLFGGRLEISGWYMPFVLFIKAILFGGIEEIGWRYTFQPIIQEKLNYVISTIVTFLLWGIWHILYFYIEGSLYQIQMISFLFGLLTNCFILSALYIKTRSLWICVMTHALINMFTQILMDGNFYLSIICKVIIIIFAIMIAKKYEEPVVE